MPVDESLWKRLEEDGDQRRVSDRGMKVCRHSQSGPSEKVGCDHMGHLAVIILNVLESVREEHCCMRSIERSERKAAARGTHPKALDISSAKQPTSAYFVAFQGSS